MDRKLFLYGILINLNGKWYVKFGQTSQFSKNDAIKYIINETVGKLRAVISNEDIIFCVDVTKNAEKDIFENNFNGSSPYYEKYDDYVRDSFIKKNELHTGYHTYTNRNEEGGGSRELHEYDSNISKEEICEEWNRIINDFIFGNKKLLKYSLRDSQKRLIEKIVNYILDLNSKGILNLSRKTRRFLLNSKMRSGKNHMVYQVAKKIGYNRILILTYKPGGVDEGWKDDLDHIDFDKSKFKFAKEMEDIKFDEDYGGMQVIFGSFQDAIGKEGNKEKWMSIKNQKIDMVVIDEMHYGSETKKATSFLDSLNYIFLLNLSGTPLKALRRGGFTKEQIGHFTYMDEQLEKNNWDYSTGENPYEWMPKLIILLMKYDKEFKNQFLKEYSKEEEPTMEKIFAKKQLTDMFLDKLWGRGSIFLNYNINHGFWLLPSVNACNMVEKCLRNNPKYNTFEIINVAGDGEKRIDEVKNKINKTNKSITISCKRFDTGSTVKQWDYVMMLSNIKSAESYWQTAFRPGTPWEEGDKREIFVFDWDYNRVLQVVGDYAKALEDYSDKSMGEIVREMLETMPIHSLGDAIPCKIDVEDVLNHYHEDRSTNFESAHLFDESNINQTICDILIGREEIKSFSQKQKLDEESESNGKTYKIEKENKIIKKENNDWIAKARSITVLLPHIIQQEENIKSLNDFNENSNLFYNVTKITLEQFKILIEFGFIDGDLIDDTIRSVSHQMHHM